MIISGKDLSKSLKEALKCHVAELEAKHGTTPFLAVILVGEDPGSVSYVTGKAKAATEVGIRNTTMRYPETITEEELLAIIDKLNADDDVDGILVQLPLPKHIDEQKVIAAIRPDKDVDSFHPVNVANLWLKLPGFKPCTPKGIIKLLDSAGVEIEGKEAVVVGRGEDVEPGLVQCMEVCVGGAKLRIAAVRRSAQCDLEVADGDVGTCDAILHQGEAVGVVVGAVGLPRGINLCLMLHEVAHE